MNGFQDFSIADLFKQVMQNPGVLSEAPQGFVQSRAPMQVPAGAQPTIPQAPQGILNSPQPDMQMPQEAAQASGPSILDRIGNAFTINKDNFGNRIGNGLIAASSSDPAKAFAQLEAADEAGKIKYNQITGTPYFWYYKPNGEMAVVDEQGKPIAAGGLAAALQSKAENEINLWKQKKVFEGEVNAGLASKKEDIKTGSEYRPLAASSKSLLDQYDKALEVVGKQGGAAQIQAAAPGLFGAFPKLAEATGGNEVANNKLLQSLAVDETLLNTAKTKGAISDKEMALFKSPVPALTDDRETVWKPWLAERKAVLEKLNQFYESEAARGDSTASRPSDGGGNRGSMSTSSIPNLSPRASQYFQ